MATSFANPILIALKVFSSNFTISAASVELTIIISDQNINVKKVNEEKIVNKAKKYLKKYSLKDTVDLILETEKINRKKVYDLCLKIKNEKN